LHRIKGSDAEAVSGPFSIYQPFRWRWIAAGEFDSCSEEGRFSMSAKTGRSCSDGRRERLEELIRQLEVDRLPVFLTEAMKSVLAAMDYNDPTLVRSSLNEAFLALAEEMGTEIPECQKLVSYAREVCREELEELRGVAAEEFDEIGRALEEFLNGYLKHFERGRDLVRSLMDRGYEVRNAEVLTRSIEDLLALKKETLGDWPWSTQDVPPPLNRDVLAKARTAISEGRGEQIDDLIKRSGGGRAKD
jgi:hypothetical protein